jgi:phosphoribosylamine--glycine ligase
MNVLIIGGGGREHALAWKLRQSPRVGQLFCAPGNGGIAEIATCLPVRIDDHDALVAAARAHEIGLTVVGPDDALAAGLVDRFEREGLRIFGPNQAAARLESSKAFAKAFMERHGIPTARAGTFSEPEEAYRFVRASAMPLVVKADGLALGKGVIIAQTEEEAVRAIHEIMEERKFGDAGRQVVIEEFLTGPECSIHALVDGRSSLLFPGAQDHKRIFDGDRGPNTGGMGTFSPSAALTPELEAQVRSLVLEPFIAGIQAEGIDFRGMLFPGLMLTPEGVKVLEFNCRFGDPETQVLLSRLEGDLLDLLEATIDRKLDSISARWRPETAVCVIMASAGYPGAYTGGKAIEGLPARGAVCFHAGTKRVGETLVTAGGRVLGITALGASMGEARERAYRAVEGVTFEGAQYRKDIGSPRA